MSSGMPRAIRLYIASSLDGYIARRNGDVDWLFGDDDYGYAGFYDSVDTTLMGRKTYEQILTFGEFPYREKTNYVFSRTGAHAPNPFVTMIRGDAVPFIRDLRNESGASIWLVGGSELNASLLQAGLIDEVILSLHPVILGEGIPLFASRPATTHLTTTGVTSYPSGLIQVRCTPVR